MKIIGKFKIFGSGPTDEFEPTLSGPVVPLVSQGADVFIGKGDSPQSAAEDAMHKAKEIYDVSSSAPNALNLWLEIGSFATENIIQLADKLAFTPNKTDKDAVSGCYFWVAIAILPEEVC